MANKYALAAKQIAKVFSEHQLTYDGTRKAVQLARNLLGLSQETKPQRLPQLPTSEDARLYWEALEKGNDIRDIVLIKLLYLTGLRNSELAKLKVEYVDLEERKIFIDQGKGSKDRYVLFTDSFALVLRAYIITLDGARNLFPGPTGIPITSRTVQLRTAKYAKESGIATRMHPHKFRHMLLTYLTEQGMPEAQIMLISGHSSKDSLAIYQHVGLPGVRKKYQEIMKGQG